MTDAPLLGSLADLANMTGMPSEPTLRKIIADNADFPIVSRGKNGRAFEIDLRAAFAFVRGLAERAEEEARAHREAVNQLSLQLLGDDALTAGERVVALSPAEQAQAMNAEFLRMKIAERRGELIRASEVESGFSDLMVWFHDGGRGFSAKCARRGSFSRQQLALIDQVMDELMAQLADRMEGVRQSVALPDDPATVAAVSEV